MRLPPDVLAAAAPGQAPFVVTGNPGQHFGVAPAARNGASWRGRRQQRNGAGPPMRLPVSRRLPGAERLPPADAPPRREHALCGASDLLFLLASAGVVQW